MPAPSVFVSHGSPMVGIEHGPFQDDLARFGAMHQPQAIVAISAHWASGDAVQIAAAAKPPLVYDFGGFPQALFDLKYDAPGSPALASRIAKLLGNAHLDPTRGWDHGVWIPLRLMYPEAGIPIVEVSLPVTMPPADLYRVGQALAPLRAEHIMILGSGGIVHNLRRVDFANRDRTPDAWAVAFDNWFAQAIAARDLPALFDYARIAPHAREAVPTPEHFLPVFVALGASGERDSVENIHTGFQHGNISMRSWAWMA